MTPCLPGRGKRPRAVLHRKTALFYRTLHGAQVGDLFMSMIHTCQLCGTNSFDYLVELQGLTNMLARLFVCLALQLHSLASGTIVSSRFGRRFLVLSGITAE